MRDILGAYRIDADGLIEDRSQPTILKERILGSVQSAQRATQQLLRVDHEDSRPLSYAIEARLLDRLDMELERCDGVLICDIAKGMLSERLLRTIIGSATNRSKPVIIDPRRVDDYSIYQGASALAPNRYEAEQATGLTLKDADAWESAARKLIDD